MTAPGLHRDMPAATYHADPCDEPSLSSSIAKILIKKTPRHARHAHPRLNPNFMRATTKPMDLGSVAHELLLGKGTGFEVCPYDDYRTKKAQEWRDDVIARRKIPIKDEELDVAYSMVDAIRTAVTEIQGVGPMLKGETETVAIWRDELGPLCRARIDWLDIDGAVIYDPKTTGNGLDDRTLNNRIASEESAFDMRAAFYLRGVEQLIGAGPIAYRWIFVESEEPFEARIFEMDEVARTFGTRKAEYAINLWNKCLTENHWPGYARKIEKSKYPGWAEDVWIDREEIHL